jgi:hypothetical protein
MSAFNLSVGRAVKRHDRICYYISDVQITNWIDFPERACTVTLASNNHKAKVGVQTNYDRL